MLFSHAHGIFIQIIWMGHKTSFNQFQRTEITQNMLSDRDNIKSDINHNNIPQKSPNFGNLAIHFTITQGSKDKPQEILKYFNLNDYKKHGISKILEFSYSNS